MATTSAYYTGHRLAEKLQLLGEPPQRVAPAGLKTE